MARRNNNAVGQLTGAIVGSVVLTILSTPLFAGDEFPGIPCQERLGTTAVTPDCKLIPPDPYWKQREQQNLPSPNPQIIKQFRLKVGTFFAADVQQFNEVQRAQFEKIFDDATQTMFALFPTLQVHVIEKIHDPFDAERKESDRKDHPIIETLFNPFDAASGELIKLQAYARYCKMWSKDVDLRLGKLFSLMTDESKATVLARKNSIQPIKPEGYPDYSICLDYKPMVDRLEALGPLQTPTTN